MLFRSTHELNNEPDNEVDEYDDDVGGVYTGPTTHHHVKNVDVKEPTHELNNEPDNEVDEYDDEVGGVYTGPTTHHHVKNVDVKEPTHELNNERNNTMDVDIDETGGNYIGETKSTENANNPCAVSNNTMNCHDKNVAYKDAEGGVGDIRQQLSVELTKSNRVEEKVTNSTTGALFLISLISMIFWTFGILLSATSNDIGRSAQLLYLIPRASVVINPIVLTSMSTRFRMKAQRLLCTK